MVTVAHWLGCAKTHFSNDKAEISPRTTSNSRPRTNENPDKPITAHLNYTTPAEAARGCRLCCFVHRHVLWVLETEAGKIRYLLALGSTEQQGLPAPGQMLDQGIHGGLEAHIHNAVRSASSSTSICRLLTSKPAVWSRCCNMRPGVQTRMFMRPNRSASSFKLLPPMTSPAEKTCFLPILRRTSKI